MQPLSLNIFAGGVVHFTEGAASTLEASAEGASNSMEKIIKYRNGDTYIGQVDTDGKRDGQGILEMSNGDVYEGQFRGGMKHGEGKYTWAGGNVYDGEWSNNKKHGKGKMKFKDVQEYDGEWSNNKKHGKGKMKYWYGSEYVGEYDGEWYGGERHGKGIFKDKDGAVYDVVCNNGQEVHMYSKLLNRSIEVWHHLDLLLVLGILMGLFAYWQM